MEENFFDFAQTKEALSQLSADLAVLDSEIKSKLTELDVERKNHHKAMSEKDAKLEKMSKTIQDTVAKIDSITGYINGVL